MEDLHRKIDKILEGQSKQGEALCDIANAMKQIAGSLDTMTNKLIGALVGKRKGEWWLQLVTVGALAAVIVFLALRISDLKTAEVSHGTTTVKVGQ